MDHNTDMVVNYRIAREAPPGESGGGVPTQAGVSSQQGEATTFGNAWYIYKFIVILFYSLRSTDNKGTGRGQGKARGGGGPELEKLESKKILKKI